MTSWNPATTQPGLFVFQDPPSGLLAIVALDDTTLGPAAGGIRTRYFEDLVEAVHEAAGLARAMTIKCAISGLNAGGGKGLVIDHAGLNRPAAFAKLGEEIERMGGLFRTAGDLGTQPEDLEAMASTCRYVHRNEGDLAQSVARTHRRCVEALAHAKGRSVGSLTVGIQGAGAIGSAVARELTSHGATVVIADLVMARAAAIGQELGVEVVSNDEILNAPTDVLAPCAIGGVLNGSSVSSVRAWGICGGANNIFASEAAERALVERGVLVVPDVLASSGGVIDGVGETVMGLDDRTPLLDAIGDKALALLEQAASGHKLPSRIAIQWAEERLSRARQKAQGQRVETS